VVRRAVTLVVLFILVYAGVHLWYGRLEKRLLSTSAPVKKQLSAAAATGRQQVKRSPAPKKSTGDFQVIVDRNIFEAVLVQEAGAKKEVAPVVKEEPKETTLKLVLQGTISGDERDARAIIVDEKEKKQDLYQVGDAVQGALITAIERGKVILEFHGRKQFLLIKERKGAGNGGAGGDYLSEPPTSGLQRQETSFSRESGGASAAPVVPHRRISFRPKKRIRQPEQEKPGGADLDEGLPEADALQSLAPELEELNN